MTDEKDCQDTSPQRPKTPSEFDLAYRQAVQKAVEASRRRGIFMLAAFDEKAGIVTLTWPPDQSSEQPSQGPNTVYRMSGGDFLQRYGWTAEKDPWTAALVLQDRQIPVIAAPAA